VAVRHHRLDVPPGASKLTLQTRGDGEVRLFGAVMESDDPGVVYDSLAINGVRASLFNRFDKTHWRNELRRREASLVIFMCGANEGNNDELALGYYKTQLTEVIRDIQSAVPDAGCLIVGPLDQAMWGDDGKLVSKRMPRKLTKAQREVSLNNQCAFFNTYEAMGGKDSMAKWYRRGLGGGDFIHPTEHGARKIGTWLAEALLAGYENYIADGEQCESNVTTL
jgi:lysophospholipase L1-like esterase